MKKGLNMLTLMIGALAWLAAAFRICESGPWSVHLGAAPLVGDLQEP